MNYLITGGHGYLAGRLAEYFSANAENKVFLASRKLIHSNLNCQKVELNWNDQSSLEKICENVDVVIQAAGMNAKDCGLYPSEAHKVNKEYTERILEASIKKKVKRFIYLSTAHVYKSPLSGNISENDPITNSHPYATTHREGELVVIDALKNQKIEGVVVRLSNSFGAPITPEANCWMLIVNDLCRQLVTQNKMVINSDVNQVRDFVAISEVSRALEFLSKTKNVEDGVFNIGGKWTPTLLELANLISESFEGLTGQKIFVEYDKSKMSSTNQQLNFEINKIESLGFVSKNKELINSEIDRTIKFCLENVEKLK